MSGKKQIMFRFEMCDFDSAINDIDYVYGFKIFIDGEKAGKHYLIVPRSYRYDEKGVNEFIVKELTKFVKHNYPLKIEDKVFFTNIQNVHAPCNWDHSIDIHKIHGGNLI